MIYLLSVLNLLGGRGLFPGGRVVFRMVLMPALVVWHVQAGWLLSAAIFASFALWAIPGHGKYFSSFHGRDDAFEHEIEWIDALGYRIFPPNGEASTNRMRGMFCMALRGMFLYPLFIALAFVNPYAPLIGLGMLLQGLCYGAGRIKEKHGVAIGETLTGSLIAKMVGLV